MSKTELPPEERPKCRVCPNPCTYYSPSHGQKRLRLYCSQDCADFWNDKRKKELEQKRQQRRRPHSIYSASQRWAENNKKAQIAQSRRQEDADASRFVYTLIQDRRYPGDIRYSLAIEPVRITRVEIPEVLKWKGIVLGKFGAEAFARMVNKAGRVPTCGGRFPNKEFGGDRNGGRTSEQGGRVYVPTNRERRAFGLPEIDLTISTGRTKNEDFVSSGTYNYWMGTAI